MIINFIDFPLPEVQSLHNKVAICLLQSVYALCTKGQLSSEWIHEDIDFPK